MSETSKPDAYADAIETGIRNSAEMLLDKRATKDKLASSLSEIGFDPRETAYIVEQAGLRVQRVNEWKRQANAVSDGEFRHMGGLVLVLVLFFLVIFGLPSHSRGQGMLAVLVLLGIGAIGFGVYGRLKNRG